MTDLTGYALESSKKSGTLMLVIKVINIPSYLDNTKCSYTAMMTMGVPVSFFWYVSFTFLVIEYHAPFLCSYMSEALQATSFPIRLTV